MQDIIDLERYPLDQPGSPAWAKLVARAKKDLATHGMFNLEGFLKPDRVMADVARLKPLFATESFRHARRHNIYFRKEVPKLPANHPALAEVEAIGHTLCAVQLGGSTVLQLYDRPNVTFSAGDQLGFYGRTA
ncbi:MAG: hypothetical protein WBA91_05185 [Paracoccaceae bacterium]